MRLPGDDLDSPVNGVDHSPNRRLRPNHTAKKIDARADRAAQREAAAPAPGRRRRVAAPQVERAARWKAKRIAAAIMPEIPADAPIIGASSPPMRKQMRDGAGGHRRREEHHETRGAEPTRHRRAEGEQPDRVDAEMRPARRAATRR